MRKWALILIGVFFFSMAAASVGGYFWGRSQLKNLLPLAKQTLKAQQIELDYQTVEIAPSGWKISVREISLKGPGIPYVVRVSTAEMGLAFSFTNPPVHLSAKLVHPVVEENRQSKPSDVGAKSAATPANALKVAGLLAPLIRVNASLENADWVEMGATGLTAALTVDQIKISEKGLRSARLQHSLRIQQLAQAPQVTDLKSSGVSFYRAHSVELTDGKLEAGPFHLSLKGQVDLTSQRWQAHVTLPETNLDNNSLFVQSEATPWLNAAKGKLALDTNAQGTGADLKSIVAEGRVSAKGLHLDVKHPAVWGEVSGEMEVDFKHSGKLALNSRLQLDLSQAKIQQEENFLKEKGVPLLIEAQISGKDDLFTLSQAKGAFHNLNFLASGELRAGSEPTGNFKATIAPTSLVGWEKFFPKYGNFRAQGVIQGDLKYHGPVKDWKSAEMDLLLRADNVKLPVLKQWIPIKGLNFEGITDLHTVTQISLGNGALKTLATQTRIDLSANSISYQDIFNKKKGEKFSANISVISSGKKADIKKGEFILGSIKALTNGTIQNFSDPVAKISFSTGVFPLAELLNFAPSAQNKVVNNLSGSVALKGRVTGPLMKKNQLPEVAGVVDLKRIAFNYLNENSKKTIQLKQMTGPISFTSNSVGSSRLAMSFPATEATLVFRLKSFERPDINFNLQASKFSIFDFFDLAKEGQPGVGLVNVPMSRATATATASAGEKEDFRKNRYAKKTKVVGEVFLKNADLGYTKAESIRGQLNYENLLMTLAPLVMKTWGGSISSQTTWDGRSPVPAASLALKAEKVNANDFVASWSDQAKDILGGQLNSDFKFQFSGQTTAEIKRSASGAGTFSLENGEIKTVKFSQKPLETLKKIPFLSNSIKQTTWEEKFSQVTGGFSVRDGKIKFTNTLIQSPLFDLNGTEAELDFEMNLNAKVTLFPKETLIAANMLEALKDDSGRASLPLILSGPVKTPSVSLDMGLIENRVKAYAARRLQNEVKSKVQGELENKVKEGLQNLFK